MSLTTFRNLLDALDQFNGGTSRPPDDPGDIGRPEDAWPDDQEPQPPAEPAPPNPGDESTPRVPASEPPGWEEYQRITGGPRPPQPGWREYQRITGGPQPITPSQTEMAREVAAVDPGQEFDPDQRWRDEHDIGRSEDPWGDDEEVIDEEEEPLEDELQDERPPDDPDDVGREEDPWGAPKAVASEATNSTLYFLAQIAQGGIRRLLRDRHPGLVGTITIYDAEGERDGYLIGSSTRIANYIDDYATAVVDALHWTELAVRRYGQQQQMKVQQSALAPTDSLGDYVMAVEVLLIAQPVVEEVSPLERDFLEQQQRQEEDQPAGQRPPDDPDDIGRQEDPWGAPKVVADDEEDPTYGGRVAWGDDYENPDLLTPQIIETIYYAKMDEDPLSLTYTEYQIVYGSLRPDFAGGPRVGGSGPSAAPGGQFGQEEADDSPHARILADHRIERHEIIGDVLYYFDNDYELWYGVREDGEKFTVGNDEAMDLVRSGTTQETGRIIDAETDQTFAGEFPNPGLYIGPDYYYFDQEFRIWLGTTRLPDGEVVPFRIAINAPEPTGLPDDSTEKGRRDRALLFAMVPKDTYYNPNIGEWVKVSDQGQHLIQRNWELWTLAETRWDAVKRRREEGGYKDATGDETLARDLERDENLYDPKLGLKESEHAWQRHPNPGLIIDGHFYYYNQETQRWVGTDDEIGEFEVKIKWPPPTELPDDSTPHGFRQRSLLFRSLPENVYYNPELQHFIRVSDEGTHFFFTDWTTFTLETPREEVLKKFVDPEEEVPPEELEGLKPDASAARFVADAIAGAMSGMMGGRRMYVRTITHSGGDAYVIASFDTRLGPEIARYGEAVREGLRFGREFIDNDRFKQLRVEYTSWKVERTESIDVELMGKEVSYEWESASTIPAVMVYWVALGRPQPTIDLLRVDEGPGTWSGHVITEAAVDAGEERLKPYWYDSEHGLWVAYSDRGDGLLDIFEEEPWYQFDFGGGEILFYVYNEEGMIIYLNNRGVRIFPTRAERDEFAIEGREVFQGRLGGYDALLQDEDGNIVRGYHPTMGGWGILNVAEAVQDRMRFMMNKQHANNIKEGFTEAAVQISGQFQENLYIRPEEGYEEYEGAGTRAWRVGYYVGLFDSSWVSPGLELRYPDGALWKRIKREKDWDPWRWALEVYWIAQSYGWNVASSYDRAGTYVDYDYIDGVRVLKIWQEIVYDMKTGELTIKGRYGAPDQVGEWDLGFENMDPESPEWGGSDPGAFLDDDDIVHDVGVLPTSLVAFEKFREGFDDPITKEEKTATIFLQEALAAALSVKRQLSEALIETKSVTVGGVPRPVRIEIVSFDDGVEVGYWVGVLDLDRQFLTNDRDALGKYNDAIYSIESTMGEQFRINRELGSGVVHLSSTPRGGFSYIEIAFPKELAFEGGMETALKEVPEDDKATFATVVVLARLAWQNLRSKIWGQSFAMEWLFEFREPHPEDPPWDPLKYVGFKDKSNAALLIVAQLIENAEGFEDGDVLGYKVGFGEPPPDDFWTLFGDFSAHDYQQVVGEVYAFLRQSAGAWLNRKNPIGIRKITMNGLDGIEIYFNKTADYSSDLLGYLMLGEESAEVSEDDVERERKEKLTPKRETFRSEVNVEELKKVLRRIGQNGMNDLIHLLKHGTMEIQADEEEKSIEEQADSLAAETFGTKTEEFRVEREWPTIDKKIPALADVVNFFIAEEERFYFKGEDTTLVGWQVPGYILASETGHGKVSNKYYAIYADALRIVLYGIQQEIQALPETWSQNFHVSLHNLTQEGSVHNFNSIKIWVNVFHDEKTNRWYFQRTIGGTTVQDFLPPVLEPGSDDPVDREKVAIESLVGQVERFIQDALYQIEGRIFEGVQAAWWEADHGSDPKLAAEAKRLSQERSLLKGSIDYRYTNEGNKVGYELGFWPDQRNPDPTGWTEYDYEIPSPAYRQLYENAVASAMNLIRRSVEKSELIYMEPAQVNGYPGIRIFFDSSGYSAVEIEAVINDTLNIDRPREVVEEERPAPEPKSEEELGGRRPYDPIDVGDDLNRLADTVERAIEGFLGAGEDELGSSTLIRVRKFETPFQTAEGSGFDEGYSVGIVDAVSIEKFWNEEKYKNALRQGAKMAFELRDELGDLAGSVFVMPEVDPETGALAVKIFMRVYVDPDTGEKYTLAQEAKARRQPLPEIIDESEGPFHPDDLGREFDIEFDLPEAGFANDLAGTLLRMITAELPELSGSIAIEPYQILNRVIYRIGYSSTLDPESVRVYNAVIAKLLPEAENMAKLRGEPGSIKVALVILPNGLSGLEVSVSVEYDRETGEWKAQDPLKALGITSEEDYIRQRMEDVDEVASYALGVLREYCPVRTGRMQRSISKIAGIPENVPVGDLRSSIDMQQLHGRHHPAGGFLIGATVNYAPFVRTYAEAVNRTIEIVRRYGEQYSPPIYVQLAEVPVNDPLIVRGATETTAKADDPHVRPRGFGEPSHQPTSAPGIMIAPYRPGEGPPTHTPSGAKPDGFWIWDLKDLKWRWWDAIEGSIWDPNKPEDKPDEGEDLPFHIRM